MEILPIILDVDFGMLGIIDDYSSLIWSMRFYTNGDFEICVPVTEKNIELLKKDRYVTREDDEHTGIIEYTEISINEDGKEILIVRGGFLPTLLKRRIIEQQTQLNSNVYEGIAKLINDNVINPSDIKRSIPDFKIKKTSIPERLEAQYTGSNLLKTIEEICQAYHIGYKAIFDDEMNIIFELYKGVDRSYNQVSNPYIVFSDEADNLLSSKYSQSFCDQVTDVLVAGEGEGLDRKTLWVNKGEHVGMMRYETYMDRRDMSTNDGAIPIDEYNKYLKEAGLEGVTSYIGIFEGVVYFDNYIFRKDVNIGDICVVENKRWNLYTNTRLIEVIESVDETGKYSLNPTFGI